MSAEIVNLRQARKTRARATKEAQSAENRVKFGRTKAEKLQSAADDALASRRLDQLKIEKPATDVDQGKP